MIVGAKFSDDFAHTAEDFLNETDIQQGIKIDDTLDEFKKFIRAFNKFAKLHRHIAGLYRRAERVH